MKTLRIAAVICVLLAVVFLLSQMRYLDPQNGYEVVAPGHAFTQHISGTLLNTFEIEEGFYLVSGDNNEPAFCSYQTGPGEERFDFGLESPVFLPEGDIIIICYYFMDVGTRVKTLGFELNKVS